MKKMKNFEKNLESFRLDMCADELNAKSDDTFLGMLV